LKSLLIVTFHQTVFYFIPDTKPTHVSQCVRTPFLELWEGGEQLNLKLWGRA